MTEQEMEENIRPDKVYDQEDCTPIAITTRRKRTRPVFLALVSALSAALVLDAYFLSLIFHLQAEKIATSQEWIWWKRVKTGMAIHETAVINLWEKTILMVSAEAHLLNAHNSLSLHDFKVGYVALRDFKRSRCLVTKVSQSNYEAVKSDVISRQKSGFFPANTVFFYTLKGLYLPRQPVKYARLQPGNMTSLELGPTLSHFCAGVPAVWLYIINSTATPEIPSSRNADHQSQERLSCLYYEFDLRSEGLGGSHQDTPRRSKAFNPNVH